MKRFEISFLAAFIFCSVLSMLGFSQRCNNVRSEFFRLHVIANSDSEYDQQTKLLVRDRLLEASEELFANATTKEDAVLAATENVDYLTQVAREELDRLGCKLPVTVEVGESYFNTRVYDSITLPAGVYTSLKVNIGSAQGQNWWCVMFPQMCLPAAEMRQDAGTVLDDAGKELVENGEKYEFRFKCIEWYESLLEHWRTR